LREGGNAHIYDVLEKEIISWKKAGVFTKRGERLLSISEGKRLSGREEGGNDL